MERLADDGITSDKIAIESGRAAAMVGVADQIIRGAALQMQAAKMVTDFDGRDPSPYLPIPKNVTPVGDRTLAIVGKQK
jgi:hypothetical protein